MTAVRRQLAIALGLALAIAPVAPSTAAAEGGPRLTVDVRKDRHAISRDIYGVNFAAELGGASVSRRLGITVDRWGGNSTSRYDWTTGFHNTGADWYFENIPPESGKLPHLRHIDGDRSASRRTVFTVPMIGWVPRTDSPDEHPLLCGFPTSTFGDQQSTDAQWDPGCGNGRSPDGDELEPGSPTITSRAVDAGDVGDLVTDLVDRYGRASAGGVRYIELDNEPALWNSTHRDVHPDPLTYDELIERTVAYARAIKRADPSALVVGPSDWGWCAYVYSPADPGGCSIGSDREAHDGMQFAAWYLAQLRSLREGGKRLLDVFDEHHYPQADGVSLSPAGSSAVQARRLRSTRSLWDPTYTDESWISDLAQGGVAVRLIPRMRAWVAANFPGTKLGITEYNFGGLESLNGALAQADVLGILGREDVTLATLWGAGSASQPWAFAFRMYRNYDGHGSAFGTTSVRARSFDPAQRSRPNGGQDELAVYAAQRSDKTLTVMVINKTGSTLRSPLSLVGDTYRSAAQVWRYSGSDLRHIVRKADASVRSGSVTLSYPARSITLLVLKPR